MSQAESMLRLLLCSVTLGTALFAAEPESVPRIEPDEPAWSALAAEFARLSDVAARFEERRYFAFRKAPAVLSGEARVSAGHGLSLHYQEPAERTIIIDDRGMLIREAGVDRRPPPDPRALAVNEALRQVLRLNLPALAETFELYGRQADGAWTLALVPRSADLRHATSRITVAGTGTRVQKVEIRRGTAQNIEILLDPPRPPATFTAEEIDRYFRGPAGGS